MSVQQIDWIARAATQALPGQMLIGGHNADAGDGASFTVISPRDGKAIGTLPQAGVADVDRAVAAARAVFDSGVWSGQTPTQRKKVLLRLADLIERDRADLALMDSLSMGAPIAMTHDHCVQWAIDCFRWYAEAADKIYDEIAPSGADVLAMIRREPVGVVGLVLPWNWPTGMIGWKVPPALVTGNSIVLKPDEQTSHSALHIARLALEAGVPEGVFNVVTGGAVAGEAIGRHLDIDAVAFTGSTAVGARFMTYAGESNIKPVWLELGGKSPNIIFPDAPDLDQAAQAAAFAIFMNSGQVCAAGSRLIVHASVADRIAEGVAQAAAIFTPGDPLNPATMMGPLAKREQFDRVTAYIDTGCREGARLAKGGKAARVDSGGFFIEPTIFDGVANSMTIAREEIFGPVLSILTFENEDEAVRIANDTQYGLAAGVWTANLARAHGMARKLRCGSVGVNVYGGDAADVTVPFGGYKRSGFGSDKSLHALDKYLNHKTVWMNIAGG